MSSYQHLSVDLETLDTQPGGLIVSIGAVAFNRGGVCSRTFAVRLSIVEALHLGFTVDAETLAWWSTQERLALAALENGLPAVRLSEGMASLREYVERHCNVDTVQMWSKGPSFDASLLNVAAKRVGLALPWRFSNERCVRTICSGVEMPKMRAADVAHNALDDALYQARCVRVGMRARSY